MKSCSRCSNMLTADATYCYVCNSEQTIGFEEFEIKVPQNDTLLRVLCILTIVGAGFSLLSLPASLIMSSKLGVEISISIICLGILIAAAKLTAAIFMLRKKLTGLYIYTVAAVCSILSSLYSVFTIVETAKTPITIVGVIAGFIISAGFLVMYWLPANKKLLS